MQHLGICFTIPLLIMGLEIQASWFANVRVLIASCLLCFIQKVLVFFRGQKTIYWNVK